jgi:hypothetical protein
LEKSTPALEIWTESVFCGCQQYKVSLDMLAFILGLFVKYCAPFSKKYLVIKRNWVAKKIRNQVLQKLRRLVEKLAFYSSFSTNGTFNTKRLIYEPF